VADTTPPNRPNRRAESRYLPIAGNLSGTVAFETQCRAVSPAVTPLACPDPWSGSVAAGQNEKCCGCARPLRHMGCLVRCIPIAARTI